MSTAEKIYEKTQTLPEPAQTAVLQIVELLAAQSSEAATPASKQGAKAGSAKGLIEIGPDFDEPLTLHETAEVRGKLAAWEEDWNAPGMEAYDRP